jgi:hypothetical protein
VTTVNTVKASVNPSSEGVWVGGWVRPGRSRRVGAVEGDPEQRAPPRDGQPATVVLFI